MMKNKVQTRQIGSVFEFRGRRYEVVEEENKATYCISCAFYPLCRSNDYSDVDEVIEIAGHCSSEMREDSKDVKFICFNPKNNA